MKGDTNWIVWLLVVVVAAGVILYLMWSKGIGPFSMEVSKTQCRMEASKICSYCVDSGNCLDKLYKLSPGCKKTLGIDQNVLSSEDSAAGFCSENSFNEVSEQ